jgi:hypothetical protein
MEQITLNNGRVIEKITHGNFYKWVAVDGLPLNQEEEKILTSLNRRKKWINDRFLIDLSELLRKYVEPKSKVLAKQIKTLVKVICHLHGYWWPKKYDCIGTYI